jgi:hypothetical protein
MLARLATQLLVDALHGVGGRLCDKYSRTGRPGEGHHIDARMAGERGADGGPVAIDEVEHPGRSSGRVHNLGER